MSIIQSGLPLVPALPFLVAAWIAFMHRQRLTAGPDTARCAAAAIGDADGNLGHGAEGGDLEAALYEAVAAVDAVARARWVRIELAVAPAISVTMDPGALQTALRDTMLTAIDAASGGQVLVTAVTPGGQLHIRITDDGPGTGPQLRKTSLQQTAAWIVSQGGSVAVDARPSRGTTVTIRLPMQAATGQYATAPDGPAQRAALADQAA
jgi:signal transduction histidine kinase